MAIQTSYLPYRLCPGAEKEDLSQSNTVIWREKYNLHLVRAVQSLWPSLADAHESKILGIRRGAPVLIAERTSYLPNNRPAEFLKSVYRGDRYKFFVELKRE